MMNPHLSLCHVANEEKKKEEKKKLSAKANCNSRASLELETSPCSFILNTESQLPVPIIG